MGQSSDSLTLRNVYVDCRRVCGIDQKLNQGFIITGRLKNVSVFAWTLGYSSNTQYSIVVP